MKTHRQTVPEDSTDPQSSLTEGDGADGRSGQSKKAAMQKKCDELLASIAGLQDLYAGILTALADSHRESLVSLQRELTRLKDAIPALEKKSIKRLKVAGTLSSIEKENQQVKLKATQRRRKDLTRMDDFTLESLRALRALNQKVIDLR